MARRAGIYCRISQDRTGAGLGVARQREDCEKLAKRLGWTVVEVFEDNDISAYSGKPRPGYQRLLDGICNGQIDAVLAWHEDRLQRSPRELEDYIVVCGDHVPTHFAQAGELDLATASGRMTARIRGAVSRQESEHKSERTRRAQRQAAEAGRWLGGAPPFGWDVRDDGSASLNHAQAGEVRNGIHALLAGASLGSIVADLNERGITTITGRTWNYSTLRQVLTRPRNAGLSVLNGEIVGASIWPSIVPEEQWRAVVALLADPSRRRSTSNRVKHLLAGIARCGTCGAKLKSASVLTGRASRTSRVVYRCPVRGPGHVARAAGPVNRQVEAVVLAFRARPDNHAVLQSDGGVDIAAQRVDMIALRQQQAEAADLYSAGSITGLQLARITRQLQTRLTFAEAAMARSARGSAIAAFQGHDPVEVWSGLPIDRRRAVIQELMTITILPAGKGGNVYAPELVRIDWAAASQ